MRRDGETNGSAEKHINKQKLHALIFRALLEKKNQRIEIMGKEIKKIAYCWDIQKAQLFASLFGDWTLEDGITTIVLAGIQTSFKGN